MCLASFRMNWNFHATQVIQAYSPHYDRSMIILWSWSLLDHNDVEIITMGIFFHSKIILWPSFFTLWTSNFKRRNIVRMSDMPMSLCCIFWGHSARAIHSIPLGETHDKNVAYFRSKKWKKFRFERWIWKKNTYIRENSYIE